MERVSPGALWGVVGAAAVICLVSAVLFVVTRNMQKPYYKGSWPPPRNLVA